MLLLAQIFLIYGKIVFLWEDNFLFIEPLDFPKLNLKVVGVSFFIREYYSNLTRFLYGCVRNLRI